MNMKDVVAILEARLKEANQNRRMSVDRLDEFELGVDCRLDDEIRWLKATLEIIYNTTPV